MTCPCESRTKVKTASLKNVTLPELVPVSVASSDWEYFYSPHPTGEDTSPSQGYPSIKVTGTHLYTWVNRVTLRIKCLTQDKSLAQDQNVMTPAGLEPGPLDRESSALIRSPRLSLESRMLLIY